VLAAHASPRLALRQAAGQRTGANPGGQGGRPAPLHPPYAPLDGPSAWRFLPISHCICMRSPESTYSCPPLTDRELSPQASAAVKIQRGVRCRAWPHCQLPSCPSASYQVHHDKYSVPLVLKRQCDRSLGPRPPGAGGHAAEARVRRPRERRRVHSGDGAARPPSPPAWYDMKQAGYHTNFSIKRNCSIS
jgi:hypothetical protein